MKIFMKYKIASHKDVINCLRIFLEKEGELAKAVCPYYYNFFALVVNKEIVYGGDPTQSLVEYTIDFKHKFYDESFSSADVMADVQKMEHCLVETYHSKDI